MLYKFDCLIIIKNIVKYGFETSSIEIDLHHRWRKILFGFRIECLVLVSWVIFFVLEFDDFVHVIICNLK